MAFGTELHLQPTNAGKLTGKPMRVACKCWFTSKGDTTPLMIKYEDEEHQIHTIHEVEVCYQEAKNFNGLETIEYGCNVIEQGRRITVKLIFMQKDCRWVMIK